MDKTSKAKARNSNIELVRIISMFLIALSHYTVHNGVNNAELPLGVNRFLLEFSALGNIGVILFVLITGYFLGRSTKPLQPKRLIKTIAEVFFYSVAIYGVLCLLGILDFDAPTFIKCLFPITFMQYWFATAYVVLYLFHPFINRLLNNLSRKEELRLIMTGLVVFSILHTLSSMNFYGNELVQFILFYIIGDYLGRYKDNLFAKKEWRSAVFIGSLLAIIVSIIGLDLLGRQSALAVQYLSLLLSLTSPLEIALAAAIFSFFIYRKETYSRAINFVAASTFAVYLISDNKFIRPILWRDLFASSAFLESGLLIGHMLLSVFVVFVACVLIDMARRALFRPTVDRLLD